MLPKLENIRTNGRFSTSEYVSLSQLFFFNSLPIWAPLSRYHVACNKLGKLYAFEKPKQDMGLPRTWPTWADWASGDSSDMRCLQLCVIWCIMCVWYGVYWKEVGKQSSELWMTFTQWRVVCDCTSHHNWKRETILNERSCVNWHHITMRSVRLYSMKGGVQVAIT